MALLHPSQKFIKLTFDLLDFIPRVYADVEVEIACRWGEVRLKWPPTFDGTNMSRSRDRTHSYGNIWRATAVFLDEARRLAPKALSSANRGLSVTK